MRITLITIGKTDSGELKSLIQKYGRRLGHYIKFDVLMLPDIKKSKHLSEEEQRKKEGEVLLKQLDPGDFLVLLDERGTQFSSMGFSKELQKRMNSGIKHLVFAIGGPYGVHDSVYQRANQQISFSKLTFSHQMIRLFAVEQIYRAFTILKNEPYHHQ